MDTHLIIRLDELDAEPEQLERSSSVLRRDLLQLDVDDVIRRGGGSAPSGSRGIEVTAIGDLLVSMKGSFEVVKRVVDIVRVWTARGTGDHARTAELTLGDKTIRLTGVSSEQQDRMIEQFVLALAQE